MGTEEGEEKGAHKGEELGAWLCLVRSLACLKH